MITCSSIGYNGRLANQMFQFASVVGVAKKLGYIAKFPAENFLPGDPHDYNGGKLRECFDIPDDFFASSDEISSSIMFNYGETIFTFNPDVLSIPDGTNMHGYFQNEKYFIDFEDEIRKIFLFREDVKKLTRIKIKKDSVSVHVRRGDYVNYPDHHPVQSLEYYIKAIETSGKKNVYVFSDDAQWCRENLELPKNNIFFVDEQNPYVSLYLMTQCDDNVISNSSFGWWGAWLNRNPNKKVIGPSLWFGSSMDKDTSDILPPLWVRI
jgi:hypothetical protein